MSYAVRLEVFEGPLDLLLSLVSKERVDVADVSISTITDEYLRAVKELGEIELDAASSFLVLAATLLELKSLKLLPRRSEVDPELAALLEERDHLLHRLIEYSTFKGAAEVMSRLISANAGYVSRVADLPAELLPKVPDIFAGLTGQMLAEAAAKALAPKPEVVVDTSHVTPILVSVGQMVDLLAEQIQGKRSTSFTELCRGLSQRIEVIVRFLALLELYKSQSVDLEQPDPFDEIVVRWRQPNVGGER